MGFPIVVNGTKKKLVNKGAKVYKIVSDWDESNVEFRRQVNLDDSSITRYDNLLIVDMSTFTNKPSAADWTNYVRVYKKDSAGNRTEINSQPIEQGIDGGNHDAIAFLIEDTSTYSSYVIYYGDTDLGAPGYTSGLTVTADTPAIGDFQILQDDYYKIDIDYSSGGTLYNINSRVSGGNILVGTKFFDTRLRGIANTYSSLGDTAPTITQVEGTTGANAGAVLAAFKVSAKLYSGGATLKDDSGVEIVAVSKYIFCDCQLVYCKYELIFQNNFTTVNGSGSGGIPYGIDCVDGYFSHISYKYSSTHVVKTIQDDTTLNGKNTSQKYTCFFDITSNDGIALHYTYLDGIYLITDWNTDWNAFDQGPDYTYGIWWNYAGQSTENYLAGTMYIEFVWQIDDFTEADGNNDDDGDQPAHRKNTELLTSLIQSLTSEFAC